MPWNQCFRVYKHHVTWPLQTEFDKSSVNVALERHEHRQFYPTTEDHWLESFHYRHLYCWQCHVKNSSGECIPESNFKRFQLSDCWCLTYDHRKQTFTENNPGKPNVTIHRWTLTKKNLNSGICPMHRAHSMNQMLTTARVVSFVMSNAAGSLFISWFEDGQLRLVTLTCDAVIVFEQCRAFESHRVEFVVSSDESVRQKDPPRQYSTFFLASAPSVSHSLRCIAESVSRVVKGDTTLHLEHELSDASPCNGHRVS